MDEIINLLIAHGYEYFTPYKSMLSEGILLEEITNDEVKISDVLKTKEFHKILFIFNKKNVDFSAVLKFISSVKNCSSEVFVLIDASEFTEEDNERVDEIIQTLSDYVTVLITDDQKDMDRFLKTYCK